MSAALLGANSFIARWTRKACVAFADPTVCAAAMVVARVGAFIHCTIQPGMALVAEAVSIRPARAKPGAVVHTTLGRT